MRQKIVHVLSFSVQRICWKSLYVFKNVKQMKSCFTKLQNPTTIFRILLARSSLHTYAKIVKKTLQLSKLLLIYQKFQNEILKFFLKVRRAFLKKVNK